MFCWNLQVYVKVSGWLPGLKEANNMKNSIVFESSLARRFLEENRGQTLLIVTGIAIGVAVMVFLTALIDGLQADLIDKTVGAAPHIVVTYTEPASLGAAQSMNGANLLIIDATQTNKRPIVDWRALEAAMTLDPRIETVLPVVDGSALIRRGSVIRGILLRGFDWDKADRIYNISNSVIAGNHQPANGSVLIGKDLAADLGVSPGDPILLEIPGQKSLALIVGGIFDLGLSAINQRWLVMDQHQAGALLGIGERITSFEMQVFDVFAAEAISQDWSGRMPTYRFESWQETNATLLAGLQSQSSSSYTIQFFVLLAVILGVASVLAISAVQKSKQIGILKAMGIRTSSVARVFMIQGAALGLLGSLLGFCLGLLMSKVFILLATTEFNLLLKPIPISVIVIATIVSATLSAYLPARRVANINPIEVIRNG
jgi:lipoprotein-releasing system permease protein